MSRSFTIVNIKRTNNDLIDYFNGRFISNSPSLAARKAFTKAYNSLDTKRNLTLIVTMKETTQGSAKKTFSYEISRINEESEVEIDGKLITFSFKMNVRACK